MADRAQQYCARRTGANGGTCSVARSVAARDGGYPRGVRRQRAREGGRRLQSSEACEAGAQAADGSMSAMPLLAVTKVPATQRFMFSVFSVSCVVR